MISTPDPGGAARPSLLPDEGLPAGHSPRQRSATRPKWSLGRSWREHMAAGARGPLRRSNSREAPGIGSRPTIRALVTLVPAPGQRRMRSSRRRRFPPSMGFARQSYVKPAASPHASLQESRQAGPRTMAPSVRSFQFRSPARMAPPPPSPPPCPRGWPVRATAAPAARHCSDCPGRSSLDAPSLRGAGALPRPRGT